MNISQTTFLSEVISGESIPVGKMAYFRARLSNKLHELILKEFVRLSQHGKISRADLARRIGRKPEQVTRWLGAPGNWTLETFSDLALGMGYEPAFSLISLKAIQITKQTFNKTRGDSDLLKKILAPSTQESTKTDRALSARLPSAENQGRNSTSIFSLPHTQPQQRSELRQ